MLEMASVDRFALHALHSTIRYRIITTTSLTLVYGVNLCLVPIAVHLMVNNGMQSRARKWLLAITTSMFTLSTVDWILSVDFTLQFIRSGNGVVSACYGRDDASACLLDKLSVAFVSPQLAFWVTTSDNALLINYIISDGILIWRAWVLCSDQSKAFLKILIIMLVINTVIYLANVVGFAIVFNLKARSWFHILIEGIQFSHQVLSLSINIFATSIIALKAWKYRRFLMESGMGVRTPTKAIRVLVLIVESGVAYILIGVMVLASLVIAMRTGRNQISSIFLHVGMQLVAMYPLVVIILVELNRSLDTTFSLFSTVIDVRDDRSLQVESIPATFTPRPVIASGGQIDPETKSPGTESHVTFDYTLEPGGAPGMSAGGSRVTKLEEEHGDSSLSTSLA